jgi:hypothetical protein
VSEGKQATLAECTRWCKLEYIRPAQADEGVTYSYVHTVSADVRAERELLTVVCAELPESGGV